MALEVWGDGVYESLFGEDTLLIRALTQQAAEVSTFFGLSYWMSFIEAWSVRPGGMLFPSRGGRLLGLLQFGLKDVVV